VIDITRRSKALSAGLSHEFIINHRMKRGVPVASRHAIFGTSSRSFGPKRRATAVFVLCVAFFIAAIWLISRPSFEKCSAPENVAERNACFDALRQDLLKSPAKGPEIQKS